MPKPKPDKLEIKWSNLSNSFTANGRDPLNLPIPPFDITNPATPTRASLNYSICYDSLALLSQPATVDHIFPYELLSTLVIRCTNQMISGALTNQAAYEAQLNRIFTTVGSRWDASRLGAAVTAFKAHTNDKNSEALAIAELSAAINQCALSPSNLMNGFPNINGLIDRRIDFPHLDIAYDSLTPGPNVLFCKQWGQPPQALTTQTYIGYLIPQSGSYLRLDWLLNSSSWMSGDLALLMTAINDAGGPYLNVISSQNTRIALALKEHRGMSAPAANVTFAHWLPLKNAWYFFQLSNNLGRYSIYSAFR